MISKTTSRGEQLFSTFCVERDGRWSGQFAMRAEANEARRWAAANLTGHVSGSIRTLRNFLPTLGHLVYELRITCN